jgi:hypothetical protein
MSPRLVRLTLRRALPPGLAVIAVALAAAFLSASWEPDALELEALAGATDPRVAAGALAREGLWTALLVTLAPFLLVRAATTLPGWRRGEVDWLLAAARRRGALVLSAYLGLLAAAGLLLLFIATAAEASAGPAPAGHALAARFATPALVVDDGQPLVRVVDPGRAAPGGTLRVRMVLAGGGRAAGLRVALRSRGPAGGVRAVRAQLASNESVEVPLPAPEGPYELVVERTDGEALVAVRENGIELLTPTASARVAGLRVALRAGLALAALLALALGLGAWLSAPTAILGALTLAAAGLLAEGPMARALPLGALAEALALAGEGVAAPTPSPRALAATAVAVSVGLLAATAGLCCWRRAP